MAPGARTYPTIGTFIVPTVRLGVVSQLLVGIVKITEVDRPAAGAGSRAFKQTASVDGSSSSLLGGCDCFELSKGSKLDVCHICLVVEDSQVEAIALVDIAAHT